MTASIMVDAYIGALLASIFFGSNYVPTKKYPTGDGMAFVWFFGNGVMVVGLLAMFINGEFIFVPSGLIGGAIWATGNMCVIPIVKTIGLGLGVLVWSGASLITGFLSGKFGWFGLEPQTVSHPALNWVGAVCAFLAMVVFFFIKPDLEDKKLEYTTINDPELSFTTKQEGGILERVPKRLRSPLGLCLAVLSGACYGLNMVPMKLWAQSLLPETPKPLSFVFSHFTGIFLFVTVVFIAYAIVNRPPQVFPEAIFPSFASGAMWGIAQCGAMVGTTYLGFTVGFPISSTGPMIVSSLWSVFYFREIRGARNLSLLALSFLLLGVGILLLVKSH